MQKIMFTILIWNAQDTTVPKKVVYCKVPVIKNFDLYNDGLNSEVGDILEQEREFFYNEWRTLEAWVVDD